MLGEIAMATVKAEIRANRKQIESNMRAYDSLENKNTVYARDLYKILLLREQVLEIWLDALRWADPLREADE